MIRKRVIVRGRVQGVGFRWSAQAEAEQLGVAGYARNLPDGTVQAEVEGPEAAVQRMLDWLRHGPPYAEVDGIDVTDVETTDRERDSTAGRFMIR
ncbi:MAG TPA: acylphosphatase [Homoserinimonas sp.]|nr:acylphosphatase [Homoserinimonas sp.]